MSISKLYNVQCSLQCEQLLTFAAAKSPEHLRGIAKHLASDDSRAPELLAEKLLTEEPSKLQQLIEKSISGAQNQTDSLLSAVKRLVNYQE